MNDAIKEANLELLIGLKQYLDQASRLRALLDRLLALAKAQLPVERVPPVGGASAVKRQGATRA
jgi:hypothetical protein